MPCAHLCSHPAGWLDCFFFWFFCRSGNLTRVRDSITIKSRGRKRDCMQPVACCPLGSRECKKGGRPASMGQQGRYAREARGLCGGQVLVGQPSGADADHIRNRAAAEQRHMCHHSRCDRLHSRPGRRMHMVCGALACAQLRCMADAVVQAVRTCELVTAGAQARSSLSALVAAVDRASSPRRARWASPQQYATRVYNLLSVRFGPPGESWPADPGLCPRARL